MSREYDVVTVLDTCVDLMVRGDVTPRFGQAEQLVESYTLEMGGSACIFACQCAKLGLTTAGVGAVGDDAFGKLVLARLEQAGVDTSFVRNDPGIQTGLGVALLRPEGDRAILTVAGSIDRADPEGLLALLPKARHLHIASYYLLKGMRPRWPGILREAKRLGLTVSLDTNWDPAERWDGIDEILPSVDILFPNETELFAFTEMRDPERAVSELAGRVPLVAVKLGADGAMAVRRGECAVRCEAPRAQVSDTVGAGDTFDAGFLFGYLNGMPLEACLRAGVYCGSRSVQCPGGFEGQPRRAELTADGLLPGGM